MTMEGSMRRRVMNCFIGGDDLGGQGWPLTGTLIGLDFLFLGLDEEGLFLGDEGVAAALELDHVDAHGIVGRLVRKGIDSGRALAEFSLDEFKEECPLVDENVYKFLGAVNAVNAMKSYGSTAPDQVRFQIDSWKNKLGL